MTKTIDKEFVRQRDDELITQGLKLHQRPFHVAVAWMKANGISGDCSTRRCGTRLWRSTIRSIP